MREIFLDAGGAAAAAGVEALHDKGAADRRLLDVEAAGLRLVVVLGIGDRGLQYLLDLVRDAPARKGQIGDRGGGALAADRLRHEVQFARAGADRAQKGRSLAVVEPALGRGLAHQLLLALLS